MQRKIETQIIQWIRDCRAREQRGEKKALLVQGQRQIGKTYSIRECISRTYGGPNPGIFRIVSINFEENPEFKDVFAGARDSESILFKLSLLPQFRDSRLKPQNGEHLFLFLDEIQACPDAITALKFLASDPHLIVVASGSLLGVSLSSVSSFPTGYVDFLTMHPLDFEEFLWARGYSSGFLANLIELVSQGEAIPAATFEEMLQNFRDYLVVGGMPLVVDKFGKTRGFLNYSAIRNEQISILNGYRNDIAKYTDKNEREKARLCYDSLPFQLGRDKKKFVYKLIESKARRSTYDSSVKWLLDAGLVIPCYHVHAIEIPLEGYADRDDFKLYSSDTGLLLAMLDPGLPDLLVKGDLLVYKGAIYENAIAQAIVAMDLQPYFYEKDNRLEIDFVEPLNGQAIPIEVKSGDNTKSRSLATVLAEGKLNLGIRLSSKNSSFSEKIISLPVFLFPFIREILAKRK
jgi:uncharacterized protein